LHVELVHRDGQWVCVSHGRNGTLIDGESVTQWPLCDGSILQLGLHGPEFQVVMESRVDSTLQTVDCTDRSALDFLVIDEQRKAEEVEQISATEAFRDLREKARRLKHGDGNDAGASKSSTHELAGIEHGPRLGGE
jgi:pSer/pThr/pTyr-binding forkhead associated (FHA) protein